MPEELAEAAARSAKKAMILTIVAVIVAVLVMVIDQGIKKSVLAEVQKARGILDEFKDLVQGHTVTVEVADGPSAREAGADPGARVSADRHLDDAAAAGTVLGETANGRSPAPRKRATRVPSGPQGDE